ncbi:TIGR03854 family LLM class F420-dependent oxidoreductase [Cryptosporangium phraense]|uniref:TIGR03854 family LLM class F420-dependent oxidoreductase n=1 Tax=Cryptosporangium phraense TaxID=2593070 RepID=A0A545ARX8_9ACTN|nr:TIGR03854 family LLM class F420-dependent oxidoreductase [Cryptosporangium phraense]TQS44069.1 TIGR03854 family LLM class F420-dependent oxidoreductase [Cryptosporangium phraense]
MKVRIGVGTGSLPAAELAPLAARLEELDVDSLWLSEQVSARSVDPMAGMAFALARTSRLKVGTGVVVLPGRNPVLFAKELASLALLAPRRVLPAVGLGPARAAERGAFPVPAGRRGAVFDEALTVVRRLLTSDSVTFAGEFFAFENLSIGERPARAPDLWLGGAVPAALERVGRFGDGWLASRLTVDECAAGIEAINAAAARAGREIEQDHFGLSLPVAFDALPDAFVEALRSRRPGVDPASLVPIGWPAIRELITRYVEAGVTKFVLYPILGPGGWDAFLDEFLEHARPLETPA